MKESNIKQEIKDLCLKKNAGILAHFYQPAEIQDIADYVADSLGLAQFGKSSSFDSIILAGVVFMGETAKILSPEKTILVPDLNAGCSLADNCPENEFKSFISQHPDHVVITYVNCSVEVKALSDILCTSSNAIKIIQSVPKDKKIIFAPDKHLGSYLKKISGRDMVLWEGSCIVHDTFELKELIKLKVRYPNALVLAHPECPEEILDNADHIGSTKSILDYSTSSKNEQFIVVTESGIIHQMEKLNPNKTFIPLSNSAHCQCAECPYMRLNSLEKIRNCLLNNEPQITVNEEIRRKAVIPLERMLQISIQ
jgi:quinolinate synthase